VEKSLRFGSPQLFWLPHTREVAGTRCENTVGSDKRARREEGHRLLVGGRWRHGAARGAAPTMLYGREDVAQLYQRIRECSAASPAAVTVLILVSLEADGVVTCAMLTVRSARLVRPAACLRAIAAPPHPHAAHRRPAPSLAEAARAGRDTAQGEAD